MTSDKNSSSGTESQRYFESERFARLKLFSFADFTRMAGKNVVIVGVGGLGAVVSEIMTRCGVGTLHIFDYDKVEAANLNRLLYREKQVGMAKVSAIKQYLHEIDPKACVICHPHDVTSGQGYDEFTGLLPTADVVFGCVDSFAVRLFLNSQCVKANVPLIDGGVSQDGISGNIHCVVPKITPCYRCNRPLTESYRPGKKPKQEATGKKNASPEHVTGLCHFTSLPTTMTIIASLQCQEGLKYLLGFGSVSPFLMYNGLEGTLERLDWKLDPNCPVCGASGEGGKQCENADKKGPPRIDLAELERAAAEFDREMEDDQ